MSAQSPIDLKILNAASPFHRMLGVEVTRAEAGEVEVVLPFARHLLVDDAGSYLHGGVIASLIDIAGDFAVITSVSRDVPTIDLRVDYLRPAKPGPLRAVGRTVRAGSTLGVADVQVFDEEGTLVAVGRGLFLTR